VALVRRIRNATGARPAPFQLFVGAVENHAAPAPVLLVLVDLEADVRVGAHHPDLAAVDRLHVDVLVVPDVDHGDDVGAAVRVARDAPDTLPAQERVDLPLVQLLDHGAIFAYSRAGVRPGRPGPGRLEPATSG
jgi:hypothetical protein